MRFERRHIWMVVGIALVVCGLALLFLPYHQEVHLSSPSGVLTLDQPTPTIRCEAPVLDAIHGEPEGWINYAPNAGVVLDPDTTFSGSFCGSAALWRGAGGLIAVIAGGFLLVAPVLRHRRTVSAPDEPAVVA